METEIREDWSLDSRKKGDLFWMKYKLYKQSEKEIGKKNSLNQSVLISYIFNDYDDVTLHEEAVLDGNEFKEYPPTASGTDIKKDAIVRAMRVRDGILLDKGSDKELKKTLDEAIDTFFGMGGVDEASRMPIEAVKQKAIKSVCEEKYRAYEEAYLKTASIPEILKPSVTYNKKKLKPSMFAEYSDYIPDNYIGQMKNGSVIAEGYYNGEPTFENFVGIVIFARHEGWKELIWVDMYPGATDDEAKEFFSYVLDEARESGKYKGAFIEIHEGENLEEISSALKSAGMSLYTEKDNIYECTLADVIPISAIMKLATRIKCRAVHDLSEEDKITIENHIGLIRRPMPLSSPLKWEDYRDDMSFAYVSEGGEEAGLFLASEIGDSIAIELLYGSNPSIVGALIGTALNKADATLSLDQKIIIPIVNDQIRPLVERQIPNASRGNIIEAVIWF